MYGPKPVDASVTFNALAGNSSDQDYNDPKQAKTLSKIGELFEAIEHDKDEVVELSYGILPKPLQVAEHSAADAEHKMDWTPRVETVDTEEQKPRRNRRQGKKKEEPAPPMIEEEAKAKRRRRSKKTNVLESPTELNNPTQTLYSDVSCCVFSTRLNVAFLFDE